MKVKQYIIRAATTLMILTSQMATSETIHFIEWLPLNSHSKIINYMKEDLKDQPLLTFNRITAYGDKEALITQLKKLTQNDPKVLGIELKELEQEKVKALVTFGDFTTQTALKLCPNVPIIALFVESPESLEKLLSTRTVSFSLLESNVKPERCLEVVSKLRENTKNIGIIHTDKFLPNQQLFETLSVKASERDIKVTQIRVDPGFCRTDSDFEKVIQNTYKEHAIDILIVPNDPNCDRFGHTIYNTAEKLGIVSIGSDSTIGKGCVLGFTPNYNKLAEELVFVLDSHNDAEAKNKTLHVPPTLVYDPKAVENSKNLNSTWLKANAKKYR